MASIKLSYPDVREFVESFHTIAMNIKDSLENISNLKDSLSGKGSWEGIACDNYCSNLSSISSSFEDVYLEMEKCCAFMVKAVDGYEEVDKKIEQEFFNNLGISNYDTVSPEFFNRTTADKVVDWAYDIAENSDARYISGGMGNGGYDCSQFIHAAYEAAGVPIPNKGNINNENMKRNYVKNGFEWVEGPLKDSSELQPGDILVNHAHHVEIYYGDNKFVGAHTDGVKKNEQISVQNEWGFGSEYWNGYLRYTGVVENNEGGM